MTGNRELASVYIAALPWEKIDDASYQWLFSEPGGPYRRRSRPYSSKALMPSSLLNTGSRLGPSQVLPSACRYAANCEVAAARLPRATMP